MGRGFGRAPVTSLFIGLFAAFPPLVVASIVGVFETPDSGAYLTYAQMLVSGPLPRGEALLGSGFLPAPLYRTPGYPAVIAFMQFLAPTNWLFLLLGLQILGQAVLAAYAHQVGLALGLKPPLAFLAALMPAVGSVAVFQSAVMTDALFGALFSAAMLLLLHAGLAPDEKRLGKLLIAGVLLGAAATIREATLYLMVGLLPAIFIATPKGRRLLGIGAAILPTILVCALITADHYRRSGHAVLSTSKQLVMVQALLPLVARGVPVFEGDTLFERTAREVIVGTDYFSIQRLNIRLFEAGMTAPEIAAAASANYARAWRQHPIEMLRATASRLPVKILWITFMPVDTAADVHRQTGEPRPWFGRPEALWQRFQNGSIFALPILLALWLGRAIGLAVTLAAILSPFALRASDKRRWAVIGAWLASGAFVAIYLPVHLEQRYLIPIVPMLCLLGGLSIQAAYEARRRRPAT
ncbi:MAG: hypothetical protein ING03_06915 [Roseomonas sp.]|nr:hypothetical protein [Roseomonas sp.]MCA3316235.1 hypothetical protein [Roseomonas sp.]MCA3318763.1 hypothetical protein [Roseomonas sp.]